MKKLTKYEIFVNLFLPALLDIISLSLGVYLIREMVLNYKWTYLLISVGSFYLSYLSFTIFYKNIIYFKKRGK